MTYSTSYYPTWTILSLDLMIALRTLCIHLTKYNLVFSFIRKMVDQDSLDI